MWACIPWYAKLEILFSVYHMLVNLSMTIKFLLVIYNITYNLIMCFVSFKPSKNCIFQGKLNCLITYPFALMQARTHSKSRANNLWSKYYYGSMFVPWMFSIIVTCNSFIEYPTLIHSVGPYIFSALWNLFGHKLR